MLALAQVWVVAGCGGGDDEPATVQTAPASTAPTARADPATATPAPGGAPSHERIAASLLGVDDLGDGWTEGPTEQSPDVICALTLLHGEPLADVSVSFRSADQLALVAHGVRAYPPGVAEQRMRDVAAASEDCDEMTGTGQVSVRALPPPMLGDEALAFRYDADDGQKRAGGEVVVIRRSSLVAVLIHISVSGEVDRAFFDPLLAEADQRLFLLAGA